MWVMDWGMTPGVRAEMSTIENNFAWGRRELHFIWGANPIDGAARDPGATPTFELRPGLLLGLITGTKKFKQYDPAATDGSQVARAILPIAYRVQDIEGNNQDKLVALIVGGPVKASKIFGLDNNARAQMSPRFFFDDDVTGSVGMDSDYPVTKSVTTNTTITAADNGTHFVAAGSAPITFTLPPPARGYHFRFTDIVNFNMIVQGPSAGQLIAFNNAAATSVALQTAGNLIGGTFEVVSSPDGTKYIVIPSGANTLTVA